MENDKEIRHRPFAIASTVATKEFLLKGWMGGVGFFFMFLALQASNRIFLSPAGCFEYGCHLSWFISDTGGWKFIYWNLYWKSCLVPFVLIKLFHSSQLVCCMVGSSFFVLIWIFWLFIRLMIRHFLSVFLFVCLFFFFISFGICSHCS